MIMSTRLRALTVTAVLALGAVTLTASTFEGTSVRVTLDKQGEVTEIVSSADSVGEFLSEQGVFLGDYDSVEPSSDTELVNSMEVKVTEGVEVNVVIDGDIFGLEKIRTKPVSLNEFVSDYSAKTGTAYMYDISSWGETLSDGLYIDLTTKASELFDVVTEIPFEINYEDTPDLYEGETKVISEGTPGTFTTTYRVDFIGGKEVAREVVFEGVKYEPTNAVYLRGVAKLAETPAQEAFALVEDATLLAERKEAERYAAELAELKRIEEENIAREKAEAAKREAERREQERIAKEKSAKDVLVAAGIANKQYVKELVMSATAYTADYASTGKNPGDPGFGITYSGMKARVGVVAVDPTVIPLGTELYIEGYGYAVAGDIGSAIKGAKIDLFFNTSRECTNYGRQKVLVYVLK